MVLNIFIEIEEINFNNINTYNLIPLDLYIANK